MRQFLSIRMILGTLVIAMIAATAFAQRGNGPAGRTEASPISTDKGFLFIDGEYVPPPYAISLNEDEIKINGIAFTAGSFDLSSYQGRGPGMRRGPGMGNGRRGGGPGQFGPDRFESNRSSGRADSQDEEAEPTASQFAMRRLFHELHSLGMGAIIVLRSDAKPMTLWPLKSGHDLLEQLVAISENQTRKLEVSDAVVDEGDRETWRQLSGAFQPTPLFVDRATQQVDELNETRSRNEGQLASKEWSDRLSYPLTMLALILVVVAVGHLMANAQATFSNATNSQEIGLLYWLRHLPLTRKATWWCCLTLTLLTARWLTFHSMLA